MLKNLPTLCGCLIIAQSAFAIANNNTSISNFPPKDKERHTAHFTKNSFSHLNVSVGVSTLGVNIEAATPLTQNLKLRGGLNFFNFNSSQYDIDIDDENGSLLRSFWYRSYL